MLNKRNDEPAQESESDTSPIELLTIEEITELLKVSVSAIRRLQGGRRIPFIKVGGSVRFLRSDVIEYVRKNRIESMR
jgi:excisionase family DNA binding protein